MTDDIDEYDDLAGILDDDLDDMTDGFLVDDILALAGDDEFDALETEYVPAPRTYKESPRRRFVRLRQRHRLAEVVPAAPAPGESIHVAGGGLFDYWTLVPQIIDWIGRADEFYCSTWVVNRPVVVELLALHDAGRIAPGKISFLSGMYLKRRSTDVYTMLLDGLRARGGRYRALKLHAKVILIACAERDCWITCEGSANLTANPRLEQSTIINDRGVYNFHRAWMEECFAAPPARRRKLKP